jgi:hypothetical protein
MSFSIDSRGGALLVMMGQQTRSESLFHYFRMEDHISENQLLRLVNRHIQIRADASPDRTITRTRRFVRGVYGWHQRGDESRG